MRELWNQWLWPLWLRLFVSQANSCFGDNLRYIDIFGYDRIINKNSKPRNSRVGSWPIFANLFDYRWLESHVRQQVQMLLEI